MTTLMSRPDSLPDEPGAPLLAVSDVDAFYGPIQALRGVSFAVMGTSLRGRRG